MLNPPRIRISLPFWGLPYARRVVNTTIPALLAPGNVPALAQQYPVEISLVTESKLFDYVSQSRAVARLKAHAEVRMVALDDLITGIAGDYGPVLTFALVRGYEDLGERMLDYYLMFLNADFILADGCYRTVARLIGEGRRVIHCPSFRAIAEEVAPVLADRTDPETGVLAVPPREMAKLALRNKHVTVKARTVNQRLMHQWRMDQFYWYVNDETMVGYQWPVALVALRPERVMTAPKLMFDYGFIPEICPTAEKYYIGDSDDFFMLEPQGRNSGKDLVRLGGISPQDIATDLSRWTTREHRECGRQVHVFHSGDLPPDLEATVAESRRYIEDIVARLGPPNPHDDHPLFRQWWEGALERMEERRLGGGAWQEGSLSAKHNRLQLPVAVEWLLRAVYRLFFGGLPTVYRNHPLWLETHRLSRVFKEEKAAGARTLWIANPDMPMVRMAETADHWVAPSDLLRAEEPGSSLKGQRFDACFFELAVSEGQGFREMYRAARDLLPANGGRIYLSMLNPGWHAIGRDDIDFCDSVLPDLDRSTAIYAGSLLTRFLRKLYTVYNQRWRLNPALRPFLVGGFLIGLAPVTWLANRSAGREADGDYSENWAHLFARFEVAQGRDSLR